MEIGRRLCEFVAMKSLLSSTILFFFLLIFLSSCADFFHRETRIYTYKQFEIDKYKIVYGEYGHFPRRYDAYRLYKIRKNGSNKMLSTTDFKYLDSAKCKIYFEINDRRKIYFDICKLKRLKKRELE